MTTRDCRAQASFGPISACLLAGACLLAACSGGSGGADTCLPSAAPALSYGYWTDGPEARTSYQGSAVVVQRIAQEIILALGTTFVPTDPGVTRVHIRSSAAPQLPIGAQVWLTKAPDGLAAYAGSLPPRAFEVRAKQDGVPLFGSVTELPGESAGPFPVTLLEAICTETEGCVAARYHAVQVHGDTAVTTRNRDVVIIPLGGVDYRVSAGAVHVSYARPDCQLADFRQETEIQLSYEAKNLAALIPAGP